MGAVFASPVLKGFIMKRSLLGVLLIVLSTLAANAADDGWITLFDGKTLDGWKANEKPEQWTVIDGAIVAHGTRSHLFYVGNDPAKPADFKNFHFKADVLTKPNSNSGVFFHSKFQKEGWPEAGHEAQVNQTQGDPVKTGSIYNVVKNFVAPAKDDEWFTYEIIVNGQNIETKANGKTIVSYVEPKGIEGPRKLSSGTFAIQAHDPGSTVIYKNIMVKPLP
jgi:hypothetical protein